MLLPAINYLLFWLQKDTTIVPTKNKNAGLHSTTQSDVVIDHMAGESKKPEIICFYNMTYGAVDIIDVMLGLYSCTRIQMWW